MNYRIEYAKVANMDIAELKKSDLPAYNKLLMLIQELHEHPRTGTGKPELLNHGKFKGLWSRRITGKHRLVYSIKDAEILVLVLSASFHYDDK
jgi:toxin YoeB